MSLNEKFNIDSETTEPPHDVVEYVPVTSIKDDSDYARAKMRELIDRATETANEIAFIAKDRQAARDYEVTAQLLKVASEMTSDLLKLQKTKKEIDNIGKPKSLNQINKNNVFVGSLKELVQALKDNKITEEESPLELIEDNSDGS